MSEKFSKLMGGFCRYTALAHYVTVALGLVLIIGLFATDIFTIQSDFLNTLGELLGFLFAFSLLASVPLAILSFLFCTRDLPMVLSGVLLLTVAALIWFYEEVSIITEYVITAVFILYSITVIYSLWLKKSSASHE